MTKLERELELLAKDMVCAEDFKRVFKRLQTFRSMRPWRYREYWKCKLLIFLRKDLFGQPEYLWIWYKRRLNMILKGEL